jgi:hypothetical protein
MDKATLSMFITMATDKSMRRMITYIQNITDQNEKDYASAVLIVILNTTLGYQGGSTSLTKTIEHELIKAGLWLYS